MTPPATIAHYRITSKLGEGGMGAVYRATDTKLNRDVAIKVLPPAFAEDSARMQRFEREAQVLASLNHPNIAAIYGIEAGAIVMELVEGEDLKGPVPIDAAIAYARQIASGLEAAHEKGIVHRDLKPANIRITPDGTLKLLDFGLAKATETSAAASAASPTHSPTLSLAMTQAGMILGTAAYMAPEQARGKIVDRRADIWAFGVVFFELLTGKMLFAAGDTVTDIIAAVVTREPDWKLLPAETPAHIRRLLERCLRKDPKLRLRDIGEARIALDEPLAPEAPAAVIASRRSVPWWGIALAVAVLTGVAFWSGSRFALPAAGVPMRLAVDLGSGAVSTGHTAAAISPDGQRVVFSVRRSDGRTQLATRLLIQDKTMPLNGTEGAGDLFFSPDGQWIGFFAGGKLKKVPVLGGAPVPLCDASTSRGATWGEDGSIVFAPGITGGLWMVRDSGGTPQKVTEPESKKQRTHRWPHFLPGGQALLFTAHVAAFGFDEAEIDVLDWKTRQWRTVQRGGSDGRYLASGHLAYVRQGTLYAVRFDLSRREVLGTPVPVLEDVATNGVTGAAPVDASAGVPGTLVYLNGKARDPNRPLVWLDAAGNTQPMLPLAAYYQEPRFSPDGRLLAVSAGGSTAADLYVWDIQRATRAQLTYNSQSNQFPVWAPDGKHLIFSSHTNLLYTMWWIRADGAGQPVKLLEGPDALAPGSLSPDGRRLAFVRTGMDSGHDLWTVPLDLSDQDAPSPGKPEIFLQTPKSEDYPSFSPDGRWIAYESDDSGHPEVYVRPFPGPGGKWMISNGSGLMPRWSHDGHRLFYATVTGRLMVVDCQARGDSLIAGSPSPWGGSQSVSGAAFRATYDVALDGKRVVAMTSDESDMPKGNLHVTFLLNFFDELKRRVP